MATAVVHNGFNSVTELRQTENQRTNYRHASWNQNESSGYSSKSMLTPSASGRQYTGVDHQSNNQSQQQQQMAGHNTSYSADDAHTEDKDCAVALLTKKRRTSGSDKGFPTPHDAHENRHATVQQPRPHTLQLTDDSHIGHSGGSFTTFQRNENVWCDPGSQQNLLRAATLDLAGAYKQISPSQKGSTSPRDVLTHPSKPVLNDGMDNAAGNLIIAVGDILQAEDAYGQVMRNEYASQYRVCSLLGEGTFGLVVRCEDLMHCGNYVAIKIVKAKPAYTTQAVSEIKLLTTLNTTYDNSDRYHIVHLEGSFVFRRHVCLVFQLLASNVYELIKQNNFKPLAIPLVRSFTRQLLESLLLLRTAGVVHADLKPENVLLMQLTQPAIKLIDFGSACVQGHTTFAYIQSRFYRAPEVLLGLPYGVDIDLFSLGCMTAELMLGLPLFPGLNQHNQLQRVINCIGMPPDHMLELGKQSHKYFDSCVESNGRMSYSLKTSRQYAAETSTQPVVNKVYFKGNTIKEIVDNCLRADNGKLLDVETRDSLIDLLSGLIRWEPSSRYTPYMCLHHPFITKQSMASFDRAGFESLRQHSINLPRPMPALTHPDSPAFSTIHAIQVAKDIAELAKSPINQKHLTLRTLSVPTVQSQSPPTLRQISIPAQKPTHAVPQFHPRHFTFSPQHLTTADVFGATPLTSPFGSGSRRNSGRSPGNGPINCNMSPAFTGTQHLDARRTNLSAAALIAQQQQSISPTQLGVPVLAYNQNSPTAPAFQTPQFGSIPASNLLASSSSLLYTQRTYAPTSSTETDHSAWSEGQNIVYSAEQSPRHSLTVSPLTLSTTRQPGYTQYYHQSYPPPLHMPMPMIMDAVSTRSPVSTGSTHSGDRVLSGSLRDSGASGGNTIMSDVRFAPSQMPNKLAQQSYPAAEYTLQHAPQGSLPPPHQARSRSGFSQQ